MPYKFVDFHKFDKKIDVKELQFGSKIDKNSPENEKYYNIKEVLSPNTLKLDNNTVIKLIGIKEKESINGNATSYLLDKTKGQKVFLKYDNEKFDKDNNLLCYLYLKNRTFINAHLIKQGLVELDLSYDFKDKNKFIKLYGDNNS